MKKSIFENSKFYFILVFLLIYIGSNTIVSQVLLSTQVSIVLIAAILLFLAFFKFRISAQKTTLKIVLALIFLVLFSMMINADTENVFGVMIIAVKILSGFLLFSCFDRTMIMKSFTKVILIIAIASIIVTYLFPIFSIEKFFPVITNSNGIKFYNCFLSVKIDSYGYFSARNYGIFSEPAV